MDIQVEKGRGTWVVRIIGGKGVSKTFYTKQDAVFWAAGRLCQGGGGQLFIYDKKAPLVVWILEKHLLTAD